MTRRRKWLVLAFGLAVLAAPLVIFAGLEGSVNARTVSGSPPISRCVCPTE